MIYPTCPFCGRPAERPTRFEGIHFCGRHGAFEWFDRARMKDVDLTGIYQSYKYNVSLERDYRAMRPRYIRGLRARILKYFDGLQGVSFLDVGCANGEYLDCAVDLGLSPVAGVEVDEKARAKAEAFGPVFMSLKDIHETYSVVQCKNVLSNIEDFQEFFSDLLCLTKPGGVLFLDVLNQFGLVARIKKWLGRPGILRPPFVINGFSKKAVAALAEKHGVRLSRLETTYSGSDILPYRKSLALAVRGRITKAVAASTMIAAEIVPGPFGEPR